MTAFSIPGPTLFKAAEWASRAVPSRPHIPVLGGLHVVADTDGITLTGFDYDTRASVTVPCQVSTPGSMLVSSRLLTAIAKTVRGDVALDDSSGVVARAGRSEWSLPSLPIEDYPQLPVPGGSGGVVDGADLRAAVGQVLTAVGRDETLPMLTGVRMESDGERLTLVATDRFRLATTTIPWANDGGTEVAGLVPATLLETAVKAADSGPVTLAVTDSNLAVTTAGHLVLGRLLDAEFPRWRALLPELAEHAAIVDTADLVGVLDQAQVAADQIRQVRCAFTADTVEVSIRGDDRSAVAATGAELTGEDITVVLDAGFLRVAVASCGTPRVRLQFGSTPLRPILVTPDGGGELRHIVMPVRDGAGRVAA